MNTSSPAWPVPELAAMGVPEWLAGLIATAGFLGAILLVGVIAYAFWAAFRAYPRLQRANYAMMRLDPAIRRAFGRPSYGEHLAEPHVEKLIVLARLLDEEHIVKRNDARLSQARRDVYVARAVQAERDKKEVTA